jgi:hypothetical protein
LNIYSAICHSEARRYRAPKAALRKSNFWLIARYMGMEEETA